MTAEVAVINDSAVALAADSLVTVSRQGQPEKTYTANKLFTFSKHAPVGVMIYGNASVMQVPWETVIKMFRRQLGRTVFDTVEEYAEHFLDFLAASDMLFPAETQQAWFRGVLHSYLGVLRSRIDKLVKEHTDLHGGIDEKNIVRIAAETVAAEYDKVQSLEARKGLRLGFEREFLAKYTREIVDEMETQMGKLPLNTSTRRKLMDVAKTIFLKDRAIPVSETGIVVAGFGERECFPATVGVRIHGVLERQAIFSREDHDCFKGPGCAVLPFAQRDVVDSFLQGIDASTSQLFLQVVEGLLSEFTKVVADHVGLSPSETETLVDRLNDGSKNAMVVIKKKLEDQRRKQHVDPLLAAVAVLPKQDLAVLAESLVDLTSIKRKVSHGVETVGGPTDVAVISKGDGFVWIRRKHYFGADINPQFASNYVDR